ncbi:uncharacterized protein MONBRDRAFT_12252 [Monosiga brevicollis MX1]|uniref:PX domain-containing protein n=1 Tax=Monosiga brevicollis TaxID=81824 RepID=A9VBP3_MONBE|nr:uncharacterized protein MONBRDRAFT_12252 [Monosiga brevicollis MX1]EDQ85013.1 predicted protein [Monosiga brevicollis MX1]|eukprot:XP_001750183.1 hypothetical protein [Monosiga brevicollis MX1]
MQVVVVLVLGLLLGTGLALLLQKRLTRLASLLPTLPARDPEIWPPRVAASYVPRAVAQADDVHAPSTEVHACRDCGQPSCTRARTRPQRSQTHPWEGLEIAEGLDQTLHEFLDEVVRSFIYSWFEFLTDNTDFVDEVKIELRFLLATIVQRALHVDLDGLIQRTVAPHLCAHIKTCLDAAAVIREAEPELRAVSIVDNERLAGLVEAALLEDPATAHPGLGYADPAEYNQYMRRMVEALLPRLLRPNIHGSTLMRLLFRELLVTYVFKPTVDALTYPDLYNSIFDLQLHQPAPAYAYPTSSGTVEFLRRFVEQDTAGDKTHTHNPDSGLRMRLPEIMLAPELHSLFIRYCSALGVEHLLTFVSAAETFTTQANERRDDADYRPLAWSNAATTFEAYEMAAAGEPDLRLEASREAAVRAQVKAQSGEPPEQLFLQLYSIAYRLLEKRYLPGFLQSKLFLTHRLGPKTSHAAPRREKQKPETHIAGLQLPPTPSEMEDPHFDVLAGPTKADKKKRGKRAKSMLILSDKATPTTTTAAASSTALPHEPSSRHAASLSESIKRARPPVDGARARAMTLDSNARLDMLGVDTGPNSPDEPSPSAISRSSVFEVESAPMRERSATLQPVSTTAASTPRQGSTGSVGLEDFTPPSSAASAPEENATIAAEGLDESDQTPEDERQLRALKHMVVKIKNPRVVGTGSKQHVVYPILVVMKGADGHDATLFKQGEANNWTVEHRYSDFFTLDRVVKKFYPDDDLKLPAKKNFNRLDERHIEARREQLHVYLQYLLQHKLIHQHVDCRRAIYAFLRPDVDNFKSVSNIILTRREHKGHMFYKAKKEAKSKIAKLLQLFEVSRRAFDEDREEMLREQQQRLEGDTLQASMPDPALLRRPIRRENGPSLTPAMHERLAGVRASYQQLMLDKDPLPVGRRVTQLLETVLENGLPEWASPLVLLGLRRPLAATVDDFIDRFLAFQLDCNLSEATLQDDIRLLMQSVFHPEEVVRSPEAQAASRTAVRDTLEQMLQPLVKAHVIKPQLVLRVLDIYGLFQSEALNRQLLLVIFDELILQLFPEVAHDLSVQQTPAAPSKA